MNPSSKSKSDPARKLGRGRPSPDPDLGRRVLAVAQQFDSMLDAAKAAGISDDQLRRIIKAESEPSFSALAALAGAAGISLDWLAMGELPPSETPEPGIAVVRSTGQRFRTMLLVPENLSVSAGDFALIPRYDVQAAAGAGTLAGTENIVDYMAFQRDWIRRAIGVAAEKLVLISAVGDSMEPTIRAGDLLLIDTSVDRIMDDAIYVVLRGEDLVVKRIQRFMRGAVIIRSDNASAYVEETLDPGQVAELKVAGRVRWIARMI